MDLKKYELETQRTFAYRKSPLDEKTTDMLHCAIGISTEISELVEAINKNDIVNIGEEIADQMWYISNLARFINFNLEKECALIKQFTFLEKQEYLNNCVIESGNLLDLFKKSIFYNKKLDEFLIKIILTRMIINLSSLCGSLNLDLFKLLDNNINKLRIRFPDKFTQENALERNLDAERKELEK